MTFGEKLEELRKEKRKSLRETAKGIGVSAPYLSQVEKGRSAPLTPDRIECLADFLSLSAEEKNALYDLAADGGVPQDCINYLAANPAAVAALRLAKQSEAGEKEWQRMLDELARRL